MKHWHRHLISLFAIVNLVVLAGGSMKDDDEEKTAEVEKAEASASVTAEALYAAYDANEVAADDKFKGKVLEVSGTVDDIGKGLLDEMYVSLAGGRGEILGVQAYFAESQKSQIAQVQKGQSLRVKCRCDGKLMNVMLKNCTML